MALFVFCVVLAALTADVLCESDPNDLMMGTELGGDGVQDGRQKDGGEGPCVDMKDCDWYGPEICMDNVTFAAKNCRQYCGFCGVKCRDRMKTCATYSSTTCKDPTYDSWATYQCAKTCGKCYKFVKEYMPCYDRSKDCDKRSNFACGNDRTWARRQCKKSCGLCGCKDVLPNCKQFSKSTCESHRAWAKVKCASYCNLCHEVQQIKTTTEGTTSKPAATTPVSVVTRQKDGGNCADVISNCAAYGTSACKGGYEQWARINCRKTCNYCDGGSAVSTREVVTTPKACSDSIDNCGAYGASMCTAYADWANTNCQKFCGLCGAATTTTTTTTTVATTTTTLPPIETTTNQQCGDAIDNCDAYGASVCDSYKSWADENCRKFCGLCSVATTATTATTLAPQTTTAPCVDAINNCADYGANVCTDYGQWAKTNCKKHCGHCGAAGTTAPVVTTTSAPCFDQIDNCADYGAGVCSGTYEAWSKINCQKHCGICTVPSTTLAPISGDCKDKLDSCGDYGGMTCMVDEAWVKENCARTCRKC